jgi:long-subunit fatty acid transport protein
MHIRPIFPAVLSAALLFTLFVRCAQAQPAGPRDTNRTVYSFSFSPISQFESDFDHGGSFSVQRYAFNFDTSTPVTNSLRAGISLGYEFEKYDFFGTTAFAGADPWSDIHRFSAGLPVSYRMTDSWSIFVSPQVEWYGESGVDNWDDAFGYGAVFAVSYRVNPAFTLGAGAGVFRRTEETKGFPYIAVDWKITEGLRLSNPFLTSPSGPAGLELSYRISDRWEIAAGGAYRSYRFRLDDSGVAPNGVGEQESTVGYARLTYRMGRDLKLDLYGGAAFNGKMRINDRNGNELGSDDFETAPMAALSLTLNF